MSDITRERSARARRVLGLAAFFGSLAITRQTEVIGLPQQTLSCAVVVVVAWAQLPQVMLAGVIRGSMHVRQESGSGDSGMLATIAAFLSDAIGPCPLCGPTVALPEPLSCLTLSETARVLASWARCWVPPLIVRRDLGHGLLLCQTYIYPPYSRQTILSRQAPHSCQTIRLRPLCCPSPL